MKRILISMLVALPILAAAQKSYTISGKISGATSVMAYLSYGRGDKEFKDSAIISNGKFSFKGSVEEPVQAFLTVKHNTPSKDKRQNDYFPFFIENSKIEITATDSIKNAAIKGSVAEKETRQIEASIRPMVNAIIQLNDDFKGKPKDEARQRASDSVANLVVKIKTVRLDFIRSHPNSFIALYQYYLYVVDKNFDPVTMEPLYHQFSAQLKATSMGQKTLEKVESAKRRQTGVQITDFVQNDTHDQPFKLSSLRGKYVLIDFWASWCIPCRAENPNLVKAYNELKNKNFEVVGVSLDENKMAWEKAIEKDGLPWIHVSDLKGWNNAAATLYNVTAVPQNLLINPEGLIIARNLRGEDLIEKLSVFIK